MIAPINPSIVQQIITSDSYFTVLKDETVVSEEIVELASVTLKDQKNLVNTTTLSKVNDSDDNDDEFMEIDNDDFDALTNEQQKETNEVKNDIQDSDDEFCDFDEDIGGTNIVKSDSKEPAPMLVSQEEYNDYYGVSKDPDESPTGWIGWAVKIANFSESIVGNKLVQTGKAMISENVGMLVGTAFPEVMVGYGVGTTLANKFVGESENKSKIVQGVGVVTGLTAVALSTGLGYLTNSEPSTALKYMVKASGTIAGGMQGLKTMGQAVPDDYIPRTAAFLVTTGAVGTVFSGVNSLPLPTPISNMISLTEKIATPILGNAAYFAPETANLVDKVIHAKPGTGKELDPGELIQNIAKNANGSSDSLSEATAKKYIESPLIASIVKMLMKHTIDSKLATNALVRAVNDFVKVMQDETVQKKIKELKAEPSEIKKEALKKEIANLMEAQYGFVEKKLAKIVQDKSAPFISPLIKQVVDLMTKKEVELFSFELSNPNQTKDLLEILLPALIPFIGVYTKREFGKKDLSSEEIVSFYQNMNNILFAPYSDYMLARGTQGLISTMIPVMQNSKFIPSFLAEKIGNSMVEPIISLDDDEIFNIPKKTESEKAQSPKPAPKRSFWQTLRQTLIVMKFVLTVVGPKKLKQVISNFLMKRAAERNATPVVKKTPPPKTSG